MANIETLNQEEFYILLSKVEGLLNSRPLYANPSGPEDDLALTPFQIMTQRSLKISSDNSVPCEKNPVTKKRLAVFQIQKQLWERFQLEYLAYLQKRYKWRKVIMQEPNLPPATWKLGKRVKSYLDEKEVSRRQHVKTQTDVIHHAAKRLVPLLSEEGEEEESILRKSNRLQKTKSKTLLTKVIFFINVNDNNNYRINNNATGLRNLCTIRTKFINEGRGNYIPNDHKFKFNS